MNIEARQKLQILAAKATQNPTGHEQMELIQQLQSLCDDEPVLFLLRQLDNEIYRNTMLERCNMEWFKITQILSEEKKIDKIVTSIVGYHTLGCSVPSVICDLLKGLVPRFP